MPTTFMPLAEARMSDWRQNCFIHGPNQEHDLDSGQNCTQHYGKVSSVVTREAPQAAVHASPAQPRYGHSFRHLCCSLMRLKVTNAPCTNKMIMADCR